MRWAGNAVTPVSCSPDALRPSVPVSHPAVGAERRSVHHLQNGRGEHYGLCRQPGARSMADSEAPRISDRSSDSAGRPDQSSRQGRHADDGRPADFDGCTRTDAAVGQAQQPLRVDCDRHDGVVRRDRLSRRLPENHASRSSRSVAAIQAGIARSSPALRWASC